MGYKHFHSNKHLTSTKPRPCMSILTNMVYVCLAYTHPGPLDNPTYVDMTVGQLSMTNQDHSDEREFKNPLYNDPDFDPKNTNLNLPIQSQENIYESIFTETTLYSDVPGSVGRDDYYDVPRALINKWKQVNDIARDETTQLEAIYDLPPDVVQDKKYDDCYSTMGSTDLKLHPHAHPY